MTTYGIPTVKTYRPVMAAYSVSGRVFIGSRRDLLLAFVLYRSLSPLVTIAASGHGTGNASPLAPYVIPFHAPIGNSYSDPIFTDLRLLLIHSVESLIRSVLPIHLHVVISSPRGVNIHIIVSFNIISTSCLLMCV